MNPDLPKTIAENIEYFAGRTWLLPTLLEWFGESSQRMFILTGGPGTGKSMIMAWLAGHGPTPPDPTAANQLACIRRVVKASHFCIADSGNTAPRAIAQNIAQQLRSIPAFDEALKAVLTEESQIAITQQVSTVQAGAEVTGIKAGTLNLAGLRDEFSFDLVLRRPLQKLAKLGYQEPIVLLVDALDEALTYSGGPTIVRLLAKDIGLPPNVRFLVTSRDDPRIKEQFSNRNFRAFDLIKDAPPKVNDVKLFAFERLARLGEPARTDLATRISQQAAGIFLYAYMVIQQLPPILSPDLDISSLDLPEDLMDLYRRFLDRELIADDDQWFRLYVPLLGILAVAQGEGLRRELIEGILGEEEVTQAMLKCKQYISGDLPHGPFRIFHRSFVEFLLDKTKNISRPISASAMHQRIIHYYQQLVGGWPNACWSEMDGYGWRHLLAHAEQAGSVRTAPIMFEICDAGFLEAKHKTMGSTAALEDDWGRALRACRNVGDYGRFIRYGLLRARQFMDISPLQSTPIARTNAQLAVRRRSEEAVDRLASEISLIPHLHARILAEQALFDELISAGYEFPAFEGLVRSLELDLANLQAGVDRDRYLSNYLSALARAGHPGWLEKAQSHLDEVKSLLPRLSLLAILARDCAEKGNGQKAFHLLQEALEQCEGITISDDLVPDLLQMMTGVERTSPATILVGGLSTILMTAPSLDEQGCARVVVEARAQFHRIMEQFDTSEAALQLLHLNRLAIQALDAAGLRDRAQEMAHEVMQPYLRILAEKNAPGKAQGFIPSSQFAIELLALMPILIPFGSEGDREVWWQLFRGSLADVSSDSDLRQIAQVAGDLSTIAVDDVEVDAVLQAVEDRASPLLFNDVGFVIAAHLAQGYGHTNNVAHACDLVSRILDQVSAQQLGRSQYPMEAEFWANGITAVWAAACCCGERGLVERTLAWLQEIAFSAVPFNIRADLWLQAIIAVHDLSDLDLADDVFDQLKLRSVENVERGPFLATACQQLADSYTELVVLSEAQRLLADCIRIARDTMIDEPRVNLLALAAGNYARLGDTKASTDLIREVLQAIPEIEGDNIQANCLKNTFNAIDLLADASQSGRGEAMQLLEQAIGIAQSIGLDEYALKALAFFVPKAAAHNLAAPVEAMKERLRKLEGADEAKCLSSRLQVAWALHQAGKEQDAQDLLTQVETAAYKMPQREDYERNVLCQICEELVAFLDSMAAIQQAIRWRELAMTLAEQTQDPQFRTSACASLARIEARFKDARNAGNWLVEAINAWHRIEERFIASSYIGDIYRAWAAIPDPEERWSRLDAMQTVFRRVPDIDERDAWQAQLAISFLEDCARFRELMTPVVGQSGIDVLLSTIYNTEEISSGILPEALYDILEKASRLSRLGFAGFALLATQAGIRHRVLDSASPVPALVTLETTFREIVVVDLRTS